MPKVSSPLRPDWAEISQREFRYQYQQINSAADLAAFWRVKPFQLNYYAFHADKTELYKSFRIPRKNGNERLIESPVATLKYIQRIMHESLTQVYGPHPAVHGFLAKRSIVTNAKNHIGRRYVLNTDLENFFPSITRQRIYGRLVAPPYSFEPIVANLIAALSTNWQGQLPQGSPSSPVISNIIASELDAEIAKLCGSLRCRYTRYADDITISTSQNEMPPELARYPNALGTGQVIIGNTLMDIVEKQGFKINHEKSRLQSYWTRQMCTGLVVNGSQVSLRRLQIRRLKSLLHHWEKNGWQDAAHVLHTKEGRDLFDNRQAFANHVLGKISYLKMVRGQNDPTARRFEQIIASLHPEQ